MLGEGVRAAFRLLGIEHRTVCYVEREAAAAAQLVALMEAGALHPAPVWSDLLTFDSAAWRFVVDCIVAGFPCQDLSVAGRRAGLDGKRSGLFFDILDHADRSGAWLLVLENVSGIASATATVVDEAEGELEERAAARVLGELADRGWDAEWLTLSASDVGASHGRARWFCVAWRVAHAHGAERWPHGARGFGGQQGHDERRHEAHDRFERSDDALDDAKRLQQPGQRVHQGPWAGGPGAADADRSSFELADPERLDCQRRGDAGDVARAGGEDQSEGDQRERRRPAADGGRCAVADTGEPRLPHAEQPGQPGQPEAYRRGAAAELRGAQLLFAPGPIDPRWPGIVANRPDLAPAVEPGVRMLADGMAYLVDESRAHQLRQVGNGVVPLQAAAALVQLLRRAGLT